MNRTTVVWLLKVLILFALLSFFKSVQAKQITQDATKPSPPTNVSVRQDSSSQGYIQIISWWPPEDSPVKITGYKAVVIDSSTGKQAASCVTSGLQYCKLSGDNLLPAGKTYSAFVISLHDQDESIRSKAYDFRVPLPPEELRYDPESLTSNRVTLNWLQEDNLDYKYIFEVTGGSYHINSWSCSVSDKKCNLHLTLLSPNADYDVSIKAISEEQFKSDARHVKFKTKPSDLPLKAATASHIYFNDPFDGTAILNLVSASGGNPPYTYDIYIGKIHIQTKELNGIILTPLDRWTRYEIKLKTTDTMQNSAVANPYKFVTPF